MNVIDLSALVLVVVGVFAGIRSGAFPQLGGLAGAVGGGLLAIGLASTFRTEVASLEGPSRALVLIGGIVGSMILGEFVGSSVGQAFGTRLGSGILSTIDRAFGGILGIGQAVLVVWLVGSLVAVGPFPTLAAQAQRSVAVRVTTAALPPLSSVAADIGGLIDASGLPQVFVGLEPFPAPPVETPSEVRARQIAAAAIPSTVEIVARACAYELTGTGFAVGRGYVVTNAHVVAGSKATNVVAFGGSHPATVVLFDPELDVALLWVPDLRLPALRFATATPPRGTEGAALGHPGGGPLVVLPAAVSGAYAAEGRDLYGTTIVRRDILELRARIERGDSGGPFVLADGTVGGVVFAEARSDPGVGYALSPTSVASRIAGSFGRTGAVSTGACIR
jgi:S1-C subfamily serine protease